MGSASAALGVPATWPTQQATAELLQVLLHAIPAHRVAVAVAVVLLTWLTWSLLDRFVLRPRRIIGHLTAQGIPGFPLRPVVGQFPEYLKIIDRRNKDAAYAAASHALEFEMSQTEGHKGNPWFFSMGPQVALCVADPALVRQAYVVHNDNFHKDGFLTSLKALGQGLLTSSGEQWRHQRRLMNPAFSQREVRRMHATMISCTDAALAEVQARVEKDKQAPEDMRELMSRVTLDIISQTAFGAELDSLLGPEVLRSMQTAFAEYQGGAMDAYSLEAILPALRLLPLPINLTTRRLERQVRKSMRQIIDARLQQHLSQELAKKESPDSISGSSAQGEAQSEDDTPIDLLSLLLRATGVLSPGNQGESSQLLTQQLLMDNCITFILAGHETTGNLLTWTMLLLSQHPEWQEKAREEVNAVYAANNGATPRFEQLNELKIMTWILYETLRLYPPAPLIGRECRKETKLSDTLSVPEGAELWVVISHIHLNPEYWGADAAEFKPDRFSGGLSQACSPPSAFLPFSTGPRVCVGQGFAMAEAKVILSMLLHRFKWELDASYVHHPELNITLHAKKGMPVRLTPPS